ncbi:MAG: hypothetical protein AUK47_15045 [Deltaproteobacteria bacterium CG2_30_63_29]|nr:MAG: hypothetical protein AUK47_15045 [Deltaproteobacteria bacterium CG2_30_63_29]PJB43007.1 MAG: poly(R)-hydroxyalkanoic acid synthase subunit PhaC [Deltaproteobacteria bacterium CG_4_9_14_3_um_filter_63_12]
MVKRVLNLFKRVGKKPAVGLTPADVVYRENKWRLLRYRPSNPMHPRLDSPILLVPSLINRHYVLDLMPGKSLVEYLLALGYEVLIIDWGTPTAEDRFLTFDDVCDKALGRAVRKAASYGKSGKVHLLGYCLGGTLTTIYTAVRPQYVASMVALAAPIDFHDDGVLAVWMQNPKFNVDAIVNGYGNVPWQLMQSAFQMMRPTLNLSKAIGVLDKAWDDPFLDGFFALETWGNDNVSFPGECFRRYIKELYQQNQLVKGEFRLSGRPARLADIQCPVLAVTFQHDNIVPHVSAGALVPRVGSADKQQWDLPGGHVGAVVSRKASEGLWPALAEWWRQRDEVARAQ